MIVHWLCTALPLDCDGTPQHAAAKLFLLTELAFSDPTPSSCPFDVREEIDSAAAMSQFQRGQEDVLQAASLAQPAKL